MCLNAENTNICFLYDHAFFKATALAKNPAPKLHKRYLYSLLTVLFILEDTIYHSNLKFESINWSGMVLSGIEWHTIGTKDNKQWY